jgi:hypothetical protein
MRSLCDGSSGALPQGHRFDKCPGIHLGNRITGERVAMQLRPSFLCSSSSSSSASSSLPQNFDQILFSELFTFALSDDFWL